MDRINYILSVEKKSKEHHSFVRDHFDFPIDLNIDSFLNNGNKYVITARLSNSNINKIIGLSIFSLFDDRINVDYVAVDKQFRKKGINNSINIMIEDIAKSNYIDLLSACIRETNTSSIQSFTKSGFDIIGNRKMKYKNGDEKIRFFKKITI